MVLSMQEVITRTTKGVASQARLEHVIRNDTPDTGRKHTIEEEYDVHRNHDDAKVRRWPHKIAYLDHFDHLNKDQSSWTWTNVQNKMDDMKTSSRGLAHFDAILEMHESQEQGAIIISRSFKNDEDALHREPEKFPGRLAIRWSDMVRYSPWFTCYIISIDKMSNILHRSSVKDQKEKASFFDCHHS